MSRECAGAKAWKTMQLAHGIEHFQEAGREGARIRNENLSPERRSEIAKKANAARSTKARLVRVTAENERLKAALRRYGRHDADCALQAASERLDCDCGLSAALKGDE